MYLMPPHARFDEDWLVVQAKSVRSMSPTFAPRAERHAAVTAPLMPPPTTRTSSVSAESFERLCARSSIARLLTHRVNARTNARRSLAEPCP
jgi:hypothetical protein